MRSMGPYILTRRLGIGGMGEVWMGQRAVLGGAAKTVAVKLLRTDRVDATARKMFLDEARLSMLLNNSNIVQMFDAGEDDAGTCYMAMEWIDGLDLAKLGDKLRSAGEALPTHVIAYIIGELLKGLAYAHDLTLDGVKHTIVHRDISPHNVMISVSGEVKITDFGIARLTSEDTSGGHIKGKLRYMPPEQLHGDTREPTIDLFAVGAILHELLDGKKFRADVVDHGRLYGIVLNGEIPALTGAAEAIPEPLELLRAGLLNPDPGQRVSSARVAFGQLSAWSGYRDAKFELEDIVRELMGSRSSMEHASAESLSTNPSGDSATAAAQRFEGSATEAVHETDESMSPGLGPGSGSGPGSQTQTRDEPRSRTMVGSVVFALVGAGLAVFALGTTLGWWPLAPPPSAGDPSPPTPPAKEETVAAPVEETGQAQIDDASETGDGAETETEDGSETEAGDEPPTTATARAPARVKCKYLAPTRSGTKLQSRGDGHRRCDELSGEVTVLGVEDGRLRMRVRGHVVELSPGRGRRLGAKNECWVVSGELEAKYVSLAVTLGTRSCG